MSFFSGFARGFKRFGSNISVIVNTVLLALVYLLAVGPTSLIAKLTGKRFLTLKADKKAKTYWERLNLTKRPLDEYYRQF